MRCFTVVVTDLQVCPEAWRLGSTGEMLRSAQHDRGEALGMMQAKGSAWLGDDEASRGKMGRLSRQAVGAGGGVVGFDGLMPNVELHGLRPPEID